MALKGGTKLINFWGNVEKITEFQRRSRESGYFPSRVLFILVDMWLENFIDKEEVARRYDRSSKEIKERRIKRIHPKTDC